MITKDNFIKYIDKIQKLREAEDSLNLAGKQLVEFHISFAEHEQLIVDILTDIFNDSAFDWISYFIYDLNFGKDWYEGCIRDKEGNDIPLKNISDLYDLLINEY
jgi:hypothetical protein